MRLTMSSIMMHTMRNNGTLWTQPECAIDRIISLVCQKFLYTSCQHDIIIECPLALWDLSLIWSVDDSLVTTTTTICRMTYQIILDFCFVDQCQCIVCEIILYAPYGMGHFFFSLFFFFGSPSNWTINEKWVEWTQ